MYRHFFGIESYAILQLVALILFAGLAVILLRRSNIRLRHAAALTVLYVLSNFLAAKLLFDLVKAPVGRHTLFDHPALAHFFRGWLLGMADRLLAMRACLSLPVSRPTCEFLPRNGVFASTRVLGPESSMFPGRLLLRLRNIRALGSCIS
jgi:hypothetical protein